MKVPPKPTSQDIHQAIYVCLHTAQIFLTFYYRSHQVLHATKRCCSWSAILFQHL